MSFRNKAMATAAIVATIALSPAIYKQIDFREFNRRSTAEEAAKGNKFFGKVAIVTGSSSGIGISTTKVLYENGATVIMACRNKKKADQVRKNILLETGKTNKDLKESNLSIIELDLISLKSVDQFVKAFKAKYKKLNILINNAGIMGFDEFGVTKDTKIERQFGVNVLGHYLLTQQLTPLLIKSSNNDKSKDGISRVINVSSVGYIAAPRNISKWLVDDKKLKDKNLYSPMKQYGLTKACNIIYSAEYNRRYSSNGVYSISLHPGAIATGLQKNNFYLNIWNRYLPKIGIKSLSQGAATSIRIAAMSDDQFIKYGGQYFEDCNVATMYRKDLFHEKLGTMLFSLNDKLIKQYRKTTTSKL